MMVIGISRLMQALSSNDKFGVSAAAAALI